MTEKDKPSTSMTVSTKRNASSAGLNDQPYRPAKRRAPKACQCCRARKVRCNVTESGPPCMNCRLDEVECIVTESKRKRRTLPKVEQEEQVPATKLKLPRGGRLPASSVVADGVLNFASLPQIHRVRKLDQTEHVPHPLYRSHDESIAASSISAPSISSRTSSVTNSSFQEAVRLRNELSRSSMDSMKSSSTGFLSSWQSSMPTVPVFLTAVPARLGSDEIAYLHKKQAFSIPESSLRDAILRAYAEFVHPLMPILDLKNWLKIVHQGDGSSGKLSLLLFQAVMFCGSNFVDADYLLKAGYKSRADARDSFYQKTRLLYDFDYEDDQFTHVEALLLMTWSSNTTDQKKDNWHWMGIAVDTAYTIGLHRTLSYDNLEPRRRRQTRRLWWSLVIRDRLLAMECQKPVRIHLEDFDVPVLKMEDFELAIASPEAIRSEINYPSTGDITTQRSLANICIEQAKLCLCVKSDMIAGGLLSSNQKEDDLTNLEEWHNNLPPTAKTNDIAQSASHCNASVIVYRSFLQVVYLATKHALIAGATDSSTQEPGNLTQVLANLLDRHVTRRLPPSCVSILAAKITAHLQSTPPTADEAQEAQLQEFTACMQSLKELREIYPTAQASLAEIESSIRASAIHLTAEDLQPVPTATTATAGKVTKQKNKTKPSSSAAAATASVSHLVLSALRTGLVSPLPIFHPITPPPDALPSSTMATVLTATGFFPGFPAPPTPHHHQQQHQRPSTTLPSFPFPSKFTAQAPATAILTPPSSHSSLDLDDNNCGTQGSEAWPLLDLDAEGELEMAMDLEELGDMELEGDFGEFINIENFPGEIEVEGHLLNKPDNNGAVGVESVKMEIEDVAFEVPVEEGIAEAVAVEI